MNVRIKFEDFIKEIIKFMIENDMFIIDKKTESIKTDNSHDKETKGEANAKNKK